MNADKELKYITRLPHRTFSTARNLLRSYLRSTLAFSAQKVVIEHIPRLLGPRLNKDKESSLTKATLKYLFLGRPQAPRKSRWI